jgi:tetratricopeptide (TPR) repeat protein
MSALLLSMALLATTGPASTLLRDDWDVYELNNLQQSAPHAVELLEKGEQLGAAGALEDADAVFHEGEAAATYSSLLWRRDCEALTALGKREDAIKACERALEENRTPANWRALVRANVDGPAPAPLPDVQRALRIAAMQRSRTVGDYSPAAIACDVAEAIGDGVMLQHCAEELLQVAPADRETKIAVQALSTRCPPVRFWVGWLALFAAMVGTLVHAALRMLRARPRAAVAAVASTLAALILAVPGSARADSSPPASVSAAPPEVMPAPDHLSKWPIDEANPENSIPSEKDRDAEPLQFGYWLQDVVYRAKLAVKKGDHAAALRYYRALSIAVPDRSIAFSKMCEEYQEINDQDGAIETCGEAILHDGATVKDYSTFVRLLLAKPGDLSKRDAMALEQVVQHMKEDPNGGVAAFEIECQVATRTGNVAELRDCTAGLADKLPDDPHTLAYQWALAIKEGRVNDARGVIERARQLGQPVDDMERATARDVVIRRWRMISGGVAVALLVVGGALLVRGIRRRRQDAPPVEPAHVAT